MNDRTRQLIQLDRDHVWHPFTPMRQWCETDPLVIERGEGPHLIDTEGHRYIDGVSSLWCNVHGHRVPAIDHAIHEQLDRIAHSTLLGLASPPSIELAARLVGLTSGRGKSGRGKSDQVAQWPSGPVEEKRIDNAAHSATRPLGHPTTSLSKVFYSDAGATALEVAFKMAVGYWHHRGQPGKHKLIGFTGAYHGDTTGSMSVGFSELFHRPYLSMLFPTMFAPIPDACRPPAALQIKCDPNAWPSEDQPLGERLRDHCLRALEAMLDEHADEVAAIVIEPIVQGASGIVCQPAGYLRGVRELARKHDVLLIADEVATGFGRTGRMFACEHEDVVPDIMCLAKGITGGYLPLAATLCTDDIYNAFTGELSERKTLYHGHTYTGNALACAAALASLKLFDDTNLLEHIRQSGDIIHDRLNILRDHPHIMDIRQRGMMVGIELCRDRHTSEPFDFARRTGAEVCLAMRSSGLIIRPLGDVIVLMPIPAMSHDVLHKMLDIVVSTLRSWSFAK